MEMSDLVRRLVGEGFYVTIIEITPKMVLGMSIGDSGENMGSDQGAEDDQRPARVKRINWKTIAKIREAKDDGMTSAEAAKKLGLHLETVNKHWTDKEKL